MVKTIFFAMKNNGWFKNVKLTHLEVVLHESVSTLTVTHGIYPHKLSCKHTPIAIWISTTMTPFNAFALLKKIKNNKKKLN